MISIVIACKNPGLFYLCRCLASFASLKLSNSLEVLLVSSGELPFIPSDLCSSFADLKVLNMPANGVYSAYNYGKTIATGSYILFFGVDDIALPSMDLVLGRLLFNPNLCDLYAASCFIQGKGIRCPSRFDHSLVFKNWCHQGLFYSTRALSHFDYDISYPMQADHKLNIEIVSSPKFRHIVDSTVVSYFSSGGISSTIPDLLFRKNMSNIVAQAYGPFWGYLVLLKQHIANLFLGAPSNRSKFQQNLSQ